MKKKIKIGGRAYEQKSHRHLQSHLRQGLHAVHQARDPVRHVRSAVEPSVLRTGMDRSCDGDRPQQMRRRRYHPLLRRRRHVQRSHQRRDRCGRPDADRFHPDGLDQRSGADTRHSDRDAQPGSTDALRSVQSVRRGQVQRPLLRVCRVVRRRHVDFLRDVAETEKPAWLQCLYGQCLLP